MKTLKPLFIAVFVVLSYSLKAQVSVSINLGTPPQWGPVGYDEARYYYLPDVEAYYDVQSAMFIYYGNGHWNRRERLPSRYRNYDLYNGYKVVMDYRGDSPYENFREHKMKYGRGYRGESQRTIGERPEKGNSRFKGDNKGENKAKGHDERRGKRRDH
jgi:hypothetical protein